MGWKPTQSTCFLYNFRHWAGNHQFCFYMLYNHLIWTKLFPNFQVFDVDILRLTFTLLFLAKKQLQNFHNESLWEWKYSQPSLDLMKLSSPIACDIPSRHNTNFASIVEVANKVCLTLFHEMDPPTGKKLHLNIDFLLSCIFIKPKPSIESIKVQVLIYLIDLLERWH